MWHFLAANTNGKSQKLNTDQFWSYFTITWNFWLILNKIVQKWEKLNFPIKFSLLPVEVKGRSRVEFWYFDLELFFYFNEKNALNLENGWQTSLWENVLNLWFIYLCHFSLERRRWCKRVLKRSLHICDSLEWFFTRYLELRLGWTKHDLWGLRAEA